jgi:hypothetical protein
MKDMFYLVTELSLRRKRKSKEEIKEVILRESFWVVTSAQNEGPHLKFTIK